jgi:predicted short-subunit dehydrogenase-like oxidoreductase (DUF2520 family)
VPTIRIVGPGRAGRSLSLALTRAGWSVLPLLGRNDDLREAAGGVDALVVATPDDAIGSVAASVRPRPSAVVVHLAGSLGPDVLAPHPRRAALHPLVVLPDPRIGSARLLSGATFAVAGDPFARRIAEALGGTAVEVPDTARATYHAAASIAANHVVSLLGQVERVAQAAGLTLDAFLPLARSAVEDAGRLGPRRALTGPAARSDWRTLDRHLAALAPEERAAYRAGVGLALQLTVGAADASAETSPRPDRIAPATPGGVPAGSLPERDHAPAPAGAGRPSGT